MNRVKGFGAFWYDFVVGDDWVIAVGVVAALAVAALLVHEGHASLWPVLPLVVVATLLVSVRRATRHRD